MSVQNNSNDPSNPPLRRSLRIRRISSVAEPPKTAETIKSKVPNGKNSSKEEKTDDLEKCPSQNSSNGSSETEICENDVIAGNLKTDELSVEELKIKLQKAILNSPSRIPISPHAIMRRKSERLITVMKINVPEETEDKLSDVRNGNISDKEETEISREIEIEETKELEKIEEEKEEETVREDAEIDVNSDKEETEISKEIEIEETEGGVETVGEDAEVDVNDRIDKLIQNAPEDSESEEENSFLDMMAEEGEEDTPSEDSNEIVEVGEEINTTESEVSTDEAYEDDSFIDDEENHQLLSGEEYDLSFEKKKKSRIRQLSCGSDTEIVPVKKKEKIVVKKKSRIIRYEDSSDEEKECHPSLSEDFISSTPRSSPCQSQDLEKIEESQKDLEENTEKVEGQNNSEENKTCSDNSHNLTPGQNESKKIIILENIRVQDDKNLTNQVINILSSLHLEVSVKSAGKVKRKKKKKKKQTIKFGFVSANPITEESDLKLKNKKRIRKKKNKIPKSKENAPSTVTPKTSQPEEPRDLQNNSTVVSTPITIPKKRRRRHKSKEVGPNMKKPKIEQTEEALDFENDAAFAFPVTNLSTYFDKGWQQKSEKIKPTGSINSDSISSTKSHKFDTGKFISFKDLMLYDTKHVKRMEEKGLLKSRVVI